MNIHIHSAFSAQGIKEATIHELDRDYYYLATSPTSFQFGSEGLLTNYVTDFVLPAETDFHAGSDNIALHKALAAVKIRDVTIHTSGGDYYYRALSNTEFQFGIEGTLKLREQVIKSPRESADIGAEALLA
jgi:hypothetical protein